MANKKIFRIACAIGVILFVVAGWSRISFNIDILKLLPTHLKQVEGLSIFLKRFSLPNELIVTLHAPDSDTAARAADSLAIDLAKETKLVDRTVSRPPWEQKPADLAELLAVLLLNQPPDDLQKLVRNLSPEKAPETARATLEEISDSISPQEIALRSHDPYGLTQVLPGSGLLSGGTQSEFASVDGTFRVVYVEARNPFHNYQDTIVWLNAIKARAAKWNIAYPNVHLGFTGEPAFVADISGSMQWDMASSGFITLFIIALIFWLCYRRARPLFDLQAMLLITFAIALATAGLFLKQLTVIGVGFASIMIGLSVDYGYFIYQKSLRHTGTLRQLQKDCLQNIMWTAGTTAAAFFALNLSSLPGLSQLGNLVGIGVIVGAGVMLTVFAPMTLRWKKIEPKPTLIERAMMSPRFIRAATVLTFTLVLFLAGVLIVKGPPKVDASERALRPRHSGAYDAIEQLQARLIDERELLSLIVTGKDEEEVHQRLQKADQVVQDAVAKGEVQSYRSALPFWPAPENQKLNLPILARLADDLPRLRQTALDTGFTDEAFYLTDAVLQQCKRWSAQPIPIWPENESSRWIYRHIASRGNNPLVAMSLVTPTAGSQNAVTEAVQSEGVWLVSWKQLGSELRRVVPGEFTRLILGLTGIVMVLLAFAFRGIRDLLVLAVTVFIVFLSLAGAMSLLGMTWNFFNFAAILLLLGTGVDYSILLLLALKRNGGNIRDAHQSLGLVITLCAGSAAAGFGTISWANNQGLASLGQTCALGLFLDALISIFLLPVIWRVSRGWKANQPG